MGVPLGPLGPVDPDTGRTPEKLTKCEYCHRPNKAGREMCKSCGAPLPEDTNHNGLDMATTIEIRAGYLSSLLSALAPPRPPRVPDDLETRKR